jgi:hypothetical protein
MQEVINACFARAASTEHALLLLRQFESLLHSDSYKADLDAKCGGCCFLLCRLVALTASTFCAWCLDA